MSINVSRTKSIIESQYEPKIIWRYEHVWELIHSHRLLAKSQSICSRSPHIQCIIEVDGWQFSVACYFQQVIINGDVNLSENASLRLELNEIAPAVYMKMQNEMSLHLPSSRRTEWYLEVRIQTRPHLETMPITSEANISLLKTQKFSMYLKGQNQSICISPWLTSLQLDPQHELQLGVGMDVCLQFQLAEYGPFTLSVATIEKPFNALPHTNNSDVEHYQCLLHLLESGDKSDATMVLETTTASTRIELKVHQNILATMSTVFAAAFTSSDPAPQIVCNDMSELVFRTLVRFMYGGESALPLEFATNIQFVMDVLYQANRYHINALFQLCRKHIPSLITTENFLCVIKHCNMYRPFLNDVSVSIMQQFYDWTITQQLKALN